MTAIAEHLFHLFFLPGIKDIRRSKKLYYPHSIERNALIAFTV